MAEKTQCLAGQGLWNGLTYDVCTICCPDCTRVSGLDSFKSNFYYGMGYWYWAETECVCVDFDARLYSKGNNGQIYLSPSDDCVRITSGDYNAFYGEGGDDAMVVVVTRSRDNYNYLHGGDGDDHLAVGGYYNYGYGDDGDDVCSSFGGGSCYEDSAERRRALAHTSEEVASA